MPADGPLWERSAPTAARPAAPTATERTRHSAAPHSGPATAAFTLTERPGGAGGRSSDGSASAARKQPVLAAVCCCLLRGAASRPPPPRGCAQPFRPAVPTPPRRGRRSERGHLPGTRLVSSRFAVLCLALPSPAPPRRPPRPAPPPPRVSPPGSAERSRAVRSGARSTWAAPRRPEPHTKAGGRRGAAPPMLRAQPPRRRPGPGP